MACERRANLVPVKNLAFDFARLDHFFRKRAQRCLGAQLEAKALHATDQTPLAMTNGRNEFREPGSIPPKARPPL